MKKTFLSILAILFTLVAYAQQLPRAEYPRPQFERSEWVNLNGEWQFERDRAVSGKANFSTPCGSRKSTLVSTRSSLLSANRV